jgi:hypothetical protein
MTPITSFDVDVTYTALLDDASLAAHTPVADSVHPSSGPFSSEFAVVMQAMTAAAERLAVVTYRTEAAVQVQQAERPQRPQPVVTTLPHWQLHHPWQHLMLQQHASGLRWWQVQARRDPHLLTQPSAALRRLLR